MWRLRRKMVQRYIVKSPVHSNALVVIDDAKGFLVVFQVMDKGGSRPRLFQIVTAPALINLIKINGFALCPGLDFKVSLRFKKGQNVVPTLHRLLQIFGRPLAACELVIVRNQPVQPFQRPQKDSLPLPPHLIDQERVIHTAGGPFLCCQKKLPAVKAVGFVIERVKAAVSKTGKA